MVAVKTLRANVPQKAHQDFLKEASTMETLSHDNVIKLIGVITQSEPMAIVTEFMKYGSLDKYLNKAGKVIKCKQLLQMILDICEGMKYVSGLGYVHRDLAARNILVSETIVCKISDFGLARSLEDGFTDDINAFKEGKVPIRWTAPEAVLYRRFSPASDVWSFGIVIWEVFTYGQRPYCDWTNQTVINMLESGYRLPAPDQCPLGLQNLMLECWSADPTTRPNFKRIADEIASLMMTEPEVLSSDTTMIFLRILLFIERI
ncbi:unnamed protein product [Dicrocoelium dendriticum]|nr:unnamed protein product [Dicrocoelium dendriticum]